MGARRVYLLVGWVQGKPHPRSFAPTTHQNRTTNKYMDACVSYRAEMSAPAAASTFTTSGHRSRLPRTCVDIVVVWVCYLLVDWWGGGWVPHRSTQSSHTHIHTHIYIHIYTQHTHTYTYIYIYTVYVPPGVGSWRCCGPRLGGPRPWPAGRAARACGSGRQR